MSAAVQLPVQSWRLLTAADFPQVLPMLRAAVESESWLTPYADAPDSDLLAYWFGGLDNEFWALEEDGVILGGYYQRCNQGGLGRHIANGGYVVAPDAKGRGLGRVLAERSIERARERGFRGMQFNFVVASNTVAVHLWESLGFQIIGTIPAAYHYQRQRYDDAYIMFKDLTK